MKESLCRMHLLYADPDEYQRSPGKSWITQCCTLDGLVFMYNVCLVVGYAMEILQLGIKIACKIYLVEYPHRSGFQHKNMHEQCENSSTIFGKETQ